MSVEPFVGTVKAAKLLNVSLRTVQLWVEKGVLRAWKTPGGHRRIALASIEQLQQEQEVQAASSEASTPPMKVLMVEDEPSLLKLYQTYFDRWHLPVELHTATDGFRALLCIGKVKPNLIITDLMMPGMDGFQMLDAIQHTEGLEDIEIIVVTALDADEVNKRGALGSNITLLHKPIDFEVIKTLVEEKMGFKNHTATQA